MSVFTETLRQFTDRRVREIAREYGVTQVEVRDLYFWPDYHWRAILAAVKAGNGVSRRVYDALPESQRYHLTHDYDVVGI